MRLPVILVSLSLVQATAFRLEPIQKDLFGLGGSLVNAWADVDSDGDLDLFVGFNGTPNRLYLNDAGVFKDAAAAAGMADARPTRAAAWGDFDADGDPDLIVGFAPGKDATGALPVLRLYQNERGRFTDRTTPARLVVEGAAVRQLSWIDFDADGDLDLFVAFRDRPNAMFRNDGGAFTDVAPGIGLADPRKSVGAVWFDADEDGDLDLYVANMDGDANGLFRNDGGRFADVAPAWGLDWGGRAPHESANGTVRPCAADVDGDGRVDLFTANYGPNGLFLNRGGGRFEDVSKAWGVAIDGRYDTCAFADADNDGRLDLYVNGTVTGGTSYRDYLFHGAAGALVDVTPANVLDLQADHGAEWADADGDGDVDLALTGSQANGMHLLLQNQLAAPARARSIFVRVLDARGRATRAGAEVRVFAANTRRLVGAGLVDSGSGYNAQNDQPVHVGLASADRVDVEVTFPAAGRRVVTVARGIQPRGRVVTVKFP